MQRIVSLLSFMLSATFKPFMLSITMLNVAMTCAIMLNVIIISDIVLNVVASEVANIICVCQSFTNHNPMVSTTKLFNAKVN